MPRTRLQVDADRHAAALHRTLAEDLRRMREDAGISRAAVARVAGIDPSVVWRIEAGEIDPTFGTFSRVAAALGADFAARIYPQSGPAIRDRHQVRMAELLLASVAPRWQATPEVAVRRPVRGWIDLVLHDPHSHTLVATELESGLHRIEQVVRWGGEKAHAIRSSSSWPIWLAVDHEPHVSRLLVVRWTRANREVANAARRILREAFPADPGDALDALTGTAAWPGPSMLWARIEAGSTRLLDGRAV